MYKNIDKKISNIFLWRNNTYFARSILTRKAKHIKGFTLVELMVVIAIFMMISGIAIFNYSDFRSNVSLQNLADDVALSIRKAQSFAIGARGIEDSGGNIDFSKNYGVHFTVDSSTTNPQEGSYKTFILFSSTDKKYDTSGSTCGDTITNECRELFTISTTDNVKEIWVDGTKMNAQKASVDIIFKRPDTRAYFCYRASNTNSNGNCDSTNISSIKVVLSNGQPYLKEKTKTITVQNTGQISIQ